EAIDQGEGSAQPAEPHHTPVDPISSTSQPPIPSPPHPSPPPHSPPHFSTPRSYEAPLPEELKDTKQTLGNAVLKLVKKVKYLETSLKRKSKKVIVSESESEEPEDQGRIIQDIDDDPLVSLVRESMKKKSTDFGVSKEKSTDKGKRYRRRARSVAKNINIGLDAEEEINTGIKDVNTGSTKVDSGTASKRGLERISKKMTKNKAKMTKLDSEWKRL
ncbi:hypothetical protein Tco_0739952, partial [Tanacetum coccineum]